MRYLTALACVIALAVGCSDSPSDNSESRFPGAAAADGDSDAPIADNHSNDAHGIVARAIAAIGGVKARQLLRRGYVEMSVEGELPGVSQQFGTDKLTFESYFELPNFERRDVYGDPDGKHLVIISNSGKMWIGDQTGKGRSMPAPPQSVYRGPLLIGILQSLFDLLENSTKLVLEESDAELVVVGVYTDHEKYNRISFSTVTGLPTQVQKMFFDIQAENMTEPVVLTVTTFSDYKRFGSANLPTLATVRQGEKEAVAFRIISADFESSIDKQQFEIPE